MINLVEKLARTMNFEENRGLSRASSEALMIIAEARRLETPTIKHLGLMLIRRARLISEECEALLDNTLSILNTVVSLPYIGNYAAAQALPGAQRSKPPGSRSDEAVVHLAQAVSPTFIELDTGDLDVTVAKVSYGHGGVLSFHGLQSGMQLHRRVNSPNLKRDHCGKEHTLHRGCRSYLSHQYRWSLCCSWRFLLLK